MRGLLLQSCLELRLLYKRRWPLLLPAAAGMWMLLQCLNARESYTADINMIAASAHGQLMIFVTAVPILLGVLLVRRDTLSPSFEWSLGLPVANRVIVASKWTAGFLYMSSFTLAVLAVYAAAALSGGLPWASVLQEIARYAALYEMSFAAGTALGIVLGALMPLRFALPIAFCGWVFGSLFVPLLLVGSYGWYPLEAFSLNHLLNMDGSTASGAWTFPLARKEFARMDLFVAAFTLFMLSAAAALIARARPVSKPRMPLVFMTLCLLLSAAAYLPYGSLWAQRYDRLAVLQAAASPAQSAGRQEPYQFRIDGMQLVVDRMSDGRLEMTALVSLPTAAGRPLPAALGENGVRSHFAGDISFLLDPLLDVRDVTVDGKAAAWRRDGDLLSFPLELLAGKDSHFIEFHYGGIIDEWLPSGYGVTRPAFAEGDNVLLPDYIGWYPIPGGESLKWTDFSLTDRYDAAGRMQGDFDIRLNGFDGPVYASIDEAPDSAPGRYHFAQRDAAAPVVFGGDFAEVRVAGMPIAVSTTPGSAAAGSAFLDGLRDELRYYRKWSGRELDDLRRVVFFPMSGQLPANSGDGGLARGNVYFFDSGAYSYSGPGDSRIRQTLERLLFGDTVDIYTHVNDWEQYEDPQSQYSIVQEIRAAILSLYRMDGTADGLTPVYADIPVDSPPAGRMKTMIEAAYAEGRGDLVRRVLLDMLGRGLTIKRHNDRLPYIPVQPAGASFDYPVITWNDWLAAWNEEEGR